MRTSQQTGHREYYKVGAKLTFRFKNDQDSVEREKLEEALGNAERECPPWIDNDRQGRLVHGVGNLLLEPCKDKVAAYSVSFHVFPNRRDMDRPQVYAYEKCLRSLCEHVSERFDGLQEFEIGMHTKRAQLCSRTVMTQRIADIWQLPVSTHIKNQLFNADIGTVPQLLEKDAFKLWKYRSLGLKSLASLFTVLIDQGWTESDGVLLTKNWHTQRLLCASGFYVALQELDKGGKLSLRFKTWFNEMIRDRGQEVSNRPNRKVFVKPFPIKNN